MFNTSIGAGAWTAPTARPVLTGAPRSAWASAGSAVPEAVRQTDVSRGEALARLAQDRGNLTSRQFDAMADVLNGTDSLNLTFEAFSTATQGVKPADRVTVVSPEPAQPEPARFPNAFVESESDGDKCFVSVGGIGEQHPDARQMRVGPAEPTGDSFRWGYEPDCLFFNDGLNLYGHKVIHEESIALSQQASNEGRVMRLEASSGTLFTIEVPLPSIGSTLAILRIGARSADGQFQMFVKTGKQSCEGTHRIMQCGLNELDQQCDVVFEGGHVDGRSSVTVELFSKSDKPIEFFVQ
jgi:hypothetical protein